MEDNIDFNYTINDIIYRSSINDEILYAELNDNILAFITKKNPTYIQIFNILEKTTIKTIKTNFNITLIKFNPLNNFQIACASSQKKCIIINFENEITQEVINLKSGNINTIVWSPDGNKIAYNSKNDIIIWDVVNNIIFKKLSGHSKSIETIDWNNDKFISGGKDRIFTWDVNNNFSKIANIGNEETKILKFIPNNDNYFISYNNNNIKIFNVGGILIHRNISTTYNIEGSETKFNVYNITFLQNSNEFLCSCGEGYILFNYKDVNNMPNINIVSTLLLENKFINFYQNKNLIIIDKNESSINIQKKINLMEEMPLIDKNFYSKYSSIANIYIKLFFTNYKFFTKYIVKNKIAENYDYEDNFLEIIKSNGFDQNVTINLIEFVDYIGQFLNSVNTISSKEINTIIEYNKLVNYKKVIIKKYCEHINYQNINPENMNTPQKFLTYVYNSSGVIDKKIKKEITKKYKIFLQKIKDDRKNYKKKILTIYTNFVRSYLKYLFIYYNKPYTMRYDTNGVSSLEHGQELNFLLNKPSNFYINMRISRYRYIGEEGANAGGLTRQFFTNLANQINRHNYIKKKIIDIESKKESYSYKKLSTKAQLVKHITLLENQIKTINNQLEQSNNTNNQKIKAKKNQKIILKSRLSNKSLQLENKSAYINKLKQNISKVTREIKDLRTINTQTILYNKEKLNNKLTSRNNIEEKIQILEKNNLEELKCNRNIAILEDELNNHYEILQGYERIIDILAFSKKNCLPIFLDYEVYKDMIQDIICNNISNNKLKNLTHNLLSGKKNILINEKSLYNYNSSDEIYHSACILNNNIVNNETNLNQFVNNNDIKLNNNDNVNNSVNNSVNKIRNNSGNKFVNNNENDLVNNIVNNNNDININFKNAYKNYNIINNKNKIKISENFSVITENNNFAEYINNYINRGIYQNFLDFYISHFIEPSVTINEILDVLIFENFDQTVKKQVIFKEKILKLLETFNEKETRLFNLALSGNTSLSPTYKITLHYFSGVKQQGRLPTVHSCFQHLEIYYGTFSDKYIDFDINIENFEESPEFIKAKNLFLEHLQYAYSEGHFHFI